MYDPLKGSSTREYYGESFSDHLSWADTISVVPDCIEVSSNQSDGGELPHGHRISHSLNKVGDFL